MSDQLAGQQRRLGRLALGLVLGVLLGGVLAVIADLAATRSDPLAISSWPVNPLIIVVLMGIGLLVALVLGARAIATKQGWDLGAAALAVGGLVEGAIVYIVGGVVVANWPWR
jgi:hypothetical protein